MTGTVPQYLSSPRSLPQATGSGPQVRNGGLSGFNPLFFKTAHTSPLNVHYCKYVSWASSPGISREALRTQHGMTRCQLLGGPGEGYSGYMAAPQAIGQMRVLERQGRPSQLGGPPKAVGSWLGGGPACSHLRPGAGPRSGSASTGVGTLSISAQSPRGTPWHPGEKREKGASDSSRPHGLLPTRLLCPWDFPGKSTEWGASAFSEHTLRCSKCPTHGC